MKKNKIQIICLKTLLILMFFCFSCTISKPTSSNNFDENKSINEKINEYSEISILNRIRSIPGLKINGPDDNNAQVYVTGITSIKFTQEVTFYLNGMRVGTYSQFSTLVKPGEIKSMRLLKGASASNIYGEEGTWGVMLVKTK